MRNIPPHHAPLLITTTPHQAHLFRAGHVPQKIHRFPWPQNCAHFHLLSRSLPGSSLQDAIFNCGQNPPSRLIIHLNFLQFLGGVIWSPGRLSRSERETIQVNIFPTRKQTNKLRLDARKRYFNTSAMRMSVDLCTWVNGVCVHLRGPFWAAHMESEMMITVACVMENVVSPVEWRQMSRCYISPPKKKPPARQGEKLKVCYAWMQNVECWDKVQQYKKTH